jgi:hypothetical protein
MYRYRYSSSQSMPAQSTGRLETALGAPAALAPGSYLAIVEESPEVVLGTPSAREESGFHVILGKW